MATKKKETAGTKGLETTLEAAKARLGAHGRNDPCPCGSGKKYKKCHLQGDEAATIPPTTAPDPQEHLANGWRLFEQRRPGAAEKEFHAALALDEKLAEARLGIGMARLQAGNNDGARTELDAVLKAGEKMAAGLIKAGTKDGFAQKEAQPYIRAAHALGCLEFDQNRFEESLGYLEKVYAIDEATVGTEARLIAAKALMKLERPKDAVAVLEPATKSEAASRAQLGLALAHFAAENRTSAEKALGKALDANPHFGKALLGLGRKRVDNVMGGAMAGSREEAITYAQTYGDVWTESAKIFLEESLATRAGKNKGGDTEESPSAGP